MRVIRSSIAVLLSYSLVVSVLLSSPPPAEKPAKPEITPEQAANIAKSQADPARPAKTLEWHDHYDMPWAVDPQQLEFASERLRDSFLLFDQHARALAKAKRWKKTAPDKYSYLSWNGGSDGYSREYEGRWESGDDEQHTLAVEIGLYDKKRIIQHYELNIVRKPANDWGVALRFYTSDFSSPNRVGYYLYFTHPTLIPPDSANHKLRQLPLSAGQQVFQSGSLNGTHSTLRITSADANNWNGLNETLLRDNLPLLWKSPESFRDTVLKDFDVFEANVRKWETDGGHVARWEGGTSGGDPPRETPYKIQLPEKQRQELVQAALQQSYERRKLIQDHYREMHAALVKSFPEFPALLPYFTAKEVVAP